jgi:hypothetical protein
MFQSCAPLTTFRRSSGDVNSKFEINVAMCTVSVIGVTSYRKSRDIAVDIATGYGLDEGVVGIRPPVG